MKIRMSEDYVYDTYEDEDLDYEPPRKMYSCSDRMCGALDCERCRPGNNYHEEEQ